MTNQNYNIQRRKAVADALSGVVGSLVSLWTFYPIEVIKSNLQAGSQVGKKTSLYQGCLAKTLHTASSSFCYFFFYSLIFNQWKQWTQIPKHQIHPATRLFLSAVAAMMNTLITLPLDVLSSKQQVTTEIGVQNDEISSSEDDDDNILWTDMQDSDSDSEFKDSSMYLDDEEEEEEDGNNNDKILQESLLESLSTKQQSLQPPSPTPKLHPLSSFESLDIISGIFRKYSGHTPTNFRDFTRLWKGLIPAMLLCSNPSIHYTAFDLAKTRILASKRRQQQQQQQRSTNGSNYNLTMPEAFLVGLFAKFVATIATYPLIRAKVILMVTSEKSLIGTLLKSYKEEGARGLYKGCDWQLLHTVLKSALMMMVREKISDRSRRLIVGESGS